MICQHGALDNVGVSQLWGLGFGPELQLLSLCAFRAGAVVSSHLQKTPQWVH